MKRAFLCNFVYLFGVLHAGIAILSVRKTRFLCFIGVHNMDFLFIHAGIVTRSVHLKKKKHGLSCVGHAGVVFV